MLLPVDIIYFAARRRRRFAMITPPTAATPRRFIFFATPIRRCASPLMLDDADAGASLFSPFTLPLPLPFSRRRFSILFH
jgi:hypothetical protein